eukprot:11199023-Lingulodinium_polyedra.AAC.1
MPGSSNWPATSGSSPRRGVNYSNKQSSKTEPHGCGANVPIESGTGGKRGNAYAGLPPAPARPPHPRRALE